ncbi:MAG TPA: LPS assembly lipoprotein LptE [Longimicrobiales bacterium]
MMFLLLQTGCNYGLRGGGGFPSDIRTVFIAPFGDETGRYDVGQQIFTELNDELPRALGLRLAGERAADALVRGTVTRYEDAAQNYRPGEPGSVDVVQHQVQITMSIQIIDVRRSVILFEQTAVSGRGEYRPDTQSDEVARAKAIETLIQQIINGAQSQW